MAQEYLAAATTVEAACSKWSSDLTGSNLPQLAGQAATCAAALATFDTTITGIGATGTAATDIATLVNDDQAVIADLDSLGTQTSASPSAGISEILADSTTAVAASDAVRTDLGLPPS